MATEVFNNVTGYNTVEYSDKKIVTIKNRQIIGLDSQIVNCGEIVSQYICFEMQRYIDGIDQLEKTIKIRWEHSNGEYGDDDVVNVKYGKEHIRFGWLIPQEAIEYSGILTIMPYTFSISGSKKNYLMKNCYGTITIRDSLKVS